MVLDVEPGFSFEDKARADAASAVVQRWEALMWRFQRALPDTPPGEKWQRLERIFTFRADDD
jgi:L-rhamnose mutarotase